MQTNPYTDQKQVRRYAKARLPMSGAEQLAKCHFQGVPMTALNELCALAPPFFVQTWDDDFHPGRQS